ncbi:MAG TPA: hypothetical protein VGR53_11700 [Nitrososphaerales archaeon]|nr:hypothetical protein [Nitrososphaerales archaeon]
MPQYTSRRQVAGYFDGDGSIATSDISNQPYTLSLSLIFTDQSLYQISNIRDFLNHNGIRTSNILKTSKGTANIVVVSEFHSVKKALRLMLPFLCKNANEARSALDYYDGKITGNRLIAVFQEEVEAERRERRPRKVPINVPFTRTEGDRIMKERRKDKLRDAFGKFRAKVTPEDYEDIRRGHFEYGKRLRDLVKEYPQYARETIRQVLGGGRGYVGVKGLGRVETTDSR